MDTNTARPRAKIAILTHFGSFDPGYALHVGWRERALTLERFGEDFDFLVAVDCKDSHQFPHARLCLKRINSERPWFERVKFFVDLYREVLAGYDVVLTADLVYQRKGNFLAQNAAIREVSRELPARWFHWIHSGWVYRQTFSADDPESLRFTMPEPTAKHTLVYLNPLELENVAQMYGTEACNVACVHNPKDPRSFFNLSPVAVEIVNRLSFWSKDLVQILPFCTTRMDSKGLDTTIEIFAAAKRLGLRVALVLANSHSKRLPEAIETKKKFMAAKGLVDGEDFIWTSDLIPNGEPLPRADVAAIYRLSNVFVFASWRETASNALQEAVISGCLPVLSDMVPAFQDHAPEALFFRATHKTPGLTDGATGDLQLFKAHNIYWEDLARKIARLAPKRDHLWRFSYERIYGEFRQLVYGKKTEGEKAA